MLLADDLLGVPVLAGDWRGKVGLEIESRWRGQGLVMVSRFDGEAVNALAKWRLLTRAQLTALAGLHNRERVIERVFRLGLVDRVTVAGLTSYGLSPYTARRLHLPVVSWTPIRALKLLAANQVGQVLLTCLGGRWEPEPDAGRTATWVSGGEQYSVYAYRYWPDCEGEALAVLQSVRERLLVVTPRRDDTMQLAELARPDSRIRWTWDAEIQPGRLVRFWEWRDSDLVAAETVSAVGA